MSILRQIIAELATDPEALEELRGLLDTAQAEQMLKTDEAANLLGVHPKTLTRAAAVGRVVGAYRVGVRGWRFKASELELLAPEPTRVGPAGAGRGMRRTTTSTATAAIRGPVRRAA